MTLAVAAGVALFAGAARAQSCLSYSDGLGNTTLTCPDGRTGYIHTVPGGVSAGMLGTQPYQAPAGVLAMPQTDPFQNLPATTYVTPPPPAPAPPPAVTPPPPPVPAAPAPPLTPAPALTPLQSQYLREHRAAALRQAQKEKQAGAETPTAAGAR